jgi:hypothetical protein
VRYLVEVPTAAGRVMLGPFTDLTAARAYCRGVRGLVIVALFDPVEDVRRLVEVGTVAEVGAALGMN